jgi:hypothetical protein
MCFLTGERELKLVVSRYVTARVERWRRGLRLLGRACSAAIRSTESVTLVAQKSYSWVPARALTASAVPTQTVAYSRSSTSTWVQEPNLYRYPASTPIPAQTYIAAR